MCVERGRGYVFYDVCFSGCALDVFAGNLSVAKGVGFFAADELVLAGAGFSDVLRADCVAFPFGALAEADGGVDWVMCQQSSIFDCVDLRSNDHRRMCNNPADF